MKIKSQYVKDRLAEISLQEHAVVAPDAIRQRFGQRPRKPAREFYASKYVRQMRKRDPHRNANWFDVDLAFKAGYDAALIIKGFRD